MIFRKLGPWAVAVALVGTSTALMQPAAQALPGQRLPGMPSSMWQTNARVLTMEYRNGPTTDTVDVTLTERSHDIAVENGGGAAARFDLSPTP